MPYANNQGVAIHYAVEGDGPPLVLQHGLTQCTKDWYECGYVDSLSPDFRLVLVDARANGASGKPHDPAAYALERRVSDVVAVLDALGIATAHFWGYSMGGWIGFGMAQYAPARLDRLVIGGQHPYARTMEALRQAVQVGLAQGVEAFVAAMGFGEATSEYAARLRSTDLKAYLALAQDRPNLEDMLSGIAVPCCLYPGEADPIFAQAKSASRQIPGATFFSLPGLDHGEAYVRSDLVVPRVKRFLQV